MIRQLLIAALTAWTALADFSVTLCWCPSADTNVTGYNLLVGSSPTEFQRVIPLGNVTQATVGELPRLTAVYFTVVARDDAAGLVSDQSNVVGIPVWPVINLQFRNEGCGCPTPTLVFSQVETNLVFVVEYCDDLAGGVWFVLGECAGTGGAVFVSDPAVDKRFYRARLGL